MTLPRIQYAVPQFLHVRLEIGNALRVLKRLDHGERSEHPAIKPFTKDDISKMAELVARALITDLRKAGFNPNQPRVPAGNPDGGQWTDEGGNGGARNAAPENPSDQQVVNTPPGIGHNQGPPLEDPPKIPPRPPSKLSTFAKTAAYRLASAIARLDKRVALFLAALQAASWVAQAYPSIIAYLDPPKTLDELRKNKGPGYDQHHIVEQWSEKDGMPRSKIDSPDNVVTIPRLKHWQINSWLSRPNEQYRDAEGNAMSPRDYMRGKSWEERYEFGLYVLRKFGVLKP